ncbi:MAG TPA: FCD domain-containing protein [Acidimicrobiales bacterium]|nr:FCD domain-containing protein [Acidimicrobiales bacterium]
MTGGGTATAVEVAADALRDAVLARGDGERLGSEEDLLERIGVSRPTLRQAARLLESEELLVVRRGVNGGLFARRPSTDAVARMASVYLRAEGTTVVDLARSWFLLLEQSARLAAEHPDEAVRRRLSERAADLEAAIRASGQSPGSAVVHTFALDLADASGSSTLRLFVRVLSTVIAGLAPDVRAVGRVPELHVDVLANLAQVATAVETGDSEWAARAMRRHAEPMMKWLLAQMPDRLA